ncbi:unnamed protein product [Penicillium salamii]|nr:unnamed protein product [Penicillium salamii]CAG8357452.1 unnamed protein product [Penicillium salamii]
MSDEMESQDGIDVRPMRLKVLYTFDNENKTNCLARWPHVLDLQTASLDENTTVGVIELKTCIQAIVSASPELVGQVGKDYTVYAYDYSEFETPLVGQGMLSWVLANSSAEASPSKTMITGRVCKSPLGGLFSKGAQETLEVKLRLVPVPTATHNDFDTQSWTNFVRQNPALLDQRSQSANDRGGSPMNQSGIERFHQLLSEGSTPREFAAFPSNASVRSASPSHSYAASGVSTPAHYQSYKHSVPHSDMIRPSSSASMRDCDNQTQLSHNNLRRGSIQSGYASGDEELTEAPPRKRAKVYQASWPGKSGANIERQPSSLRVAASTAASVRIHRPTPVNPALVTEHSHEEPVRPPTPMSRPSDFHRRSRPTASLLRESSTNSVASCPDPYASPYVMSDDIPTTEAAGPSPEDTRYQGLFEQSFNMPSSPPIFDSRFHNRSSPVLPTMALDTDSGFMSAGLDDILCDDNLAQSDRRAQAPKDQRSVRTTVQASSPVSTVSAARGTFHDPVTIGGTAPTQPPKDAVPALARANSGPSSSCAPTRPTTVPSRRPTSSSGAQRIAPKPLAPAPPFLSELHSEAPASDPVVSTASIEHAPPAAPVDITFLRCKTDSSNPQMQAKLPPGTKSKGNSKKSNGRARLEAALANGHIPPYCENCGAIETPSWRRAWAKEIVGGEELAEEMLLASQMLLWEPVEKNDQEQVVKFRIIKKGMEIDDDSWTQLLLCNPCGLWLYKVKSMRPESKWTKAPALQNGQKSKKRPSKTRANGPLNACPASRTRSKAIPKKGTSGPPANTVAASSPAFTDLSSVHPEGETPQMDAHYDEDETGDTPDDHSRFTTEEPRDSEEPHPASVTPGRRRSKLNAEHAIQRAAQSSPARRPEARSSAVNTTPKSVRRSLFHEIQKDGPLKELDSSMVNSCSPRRSPRIALTKEDKTTQKENTQNDLDDLFESPSIGFDSASPTPRRRNPRLNAIEKRVLGNSPSFKKRKDLGITSPARLSAERLQRIQSLHGQSPRSQKTSAKPEAESGEFENSLSSNISLDGMMLDIFDENDHTNFELENSKFAGENWADWLPSDFNPSTGSPEADNRPADDLLKSLFADADKDFQSTLLPFNFNDVGIPDSGFFSSDALNEAPKAQIGDADATSPV